MPEARQTPPAGTSASAGHGGDGVEVYLGLGSNIDPTRNLPAGLAALERRFGLLRVSSVLECEAVGFVGPRFLNLVVGLQTRLGVEELARGLRELEYEHGRPRGPVSRNSSRTLDIDLLLYGALVRHDDSLDVPRPDLYKYAFVAAPMAELAPRLRHPETGECMAEIWAAMQSGAPAMRAVKLAPAAAAGVAVGA